METHSSKIKARLGFFVICALSLFVAGVFYIGRQKHIFNPVFSLHTTFKNISGLQIGNNVRFSGINVGTVDDIHITNDTTVEILMHIDKEIQQFIKKDCQVSIGSEGLIGDRLLTITQGSCKAPSIIEGEYLTSIEPVETDAILSSLKVTGENAEVVSNQLADILYKINNGNGTLARLIEDTTIAENINQTIVNLKKSTKGLGENMEAAKHNILLRRYFRDKDKKENKDKKEKEIPKDNKTKKENKTPKETTSNNEKHSHSLFKRFRK